MAGRRRRHLVLAICCAGIVVVVMDIAIVNVALSAIRIKDQQVTSGNETWTRPPVGEDTAYRHYWELCVILCLRDGLRSGDVWVPGSRRYADPATILRRHQRRRRRRTRQTRRDRLAAATPGAACASSA
jgi:hypothetical protein